MKIVWVVLVSADNTIYGVWTTEELAKAQVANIFRKNPEWASECVMIEEIELDVEQVPYD